MPYGPSLHGMFRGHASLVNMGGGGWLPCLSDLSREKSLCPCNTSGVEEPQPNLSKCPDLVCPLCAPFCMTQELKSRLSCLEES